jgi:hypothetical protein
MNTLEALFFPGTALYSASQFPLFLVFQPLTLLLPVEPPEPADTTADIFNSHGFCQAITPSPLGKDRDRFLHLIHDIQYRKDDYAAQLSALTVAAMSTGQRRRDDSEQSIIATLLGGHRLSQQVVPEDDRQARLWQARLVLKIAEILDLEEEDLAKQLALLDDQQDDLFKRLHGEIEEEDEESLLEELQQLRKKMNRPDRKAIRNRMNAWKHLFNAGKVSGKQIWTTTMAEAADILLEDYENRAGSAAEIFIEIPMPANIGWNTKEALERVNVFRRENSAVGDSLAQIVMIMESKNSQALVEQWSEAISRTFPETNFGRTILTFYDLRKSSCANLMGEPAQEGELSGTLLAVLREVP